MNRWLAARFDWRAISLVLESPIAKAVALIPVFGYLIIFNQEITCWLNKTVLSNWYIFTPELKFRLVYYGGLCIVVALIIYRVFCPRALKKYDSYEDAVEAFYEGAKAKKIGDIIERHIREAHEGFRFGTFKMSVLVRHPKTFRKLSVSVSKYLATQGLDGNTLGADGEFPNEENKLYNWFKKADPQQLSKLLSHVHDRHVAAPENVELNQIGEQIIIASYGVDQRRSPFFRILAALLAYTGAVCLLAPAAETFIHVAFMDATRSAPPEWLNNFFEWDLKHEVCEVSTNDY